VFNESDKHSRGPETHYRILVVTEEFNGVSAI
jgi:stress-induced morphogen